MNLPKRVYFFTAKKDQDYVVWWASRWNKKDLIDIIWKKALALVTKVVEFLIISQFTVHKLISILRRDHYSTRFNGRG